MSDALDAVSEAMARTRKLAAGRQIRKDEIEAELAKWRRERALLEGAGGDPKVAEMGAALDERITALSTELAAVEADLAAAQTEMANLRKLGDQARTLDARAVIASATSSDPVLRSLEDEALERARAHVAELDAEARLGKELGGEEQAPAAPAKPVVSREDADAEARAAFEALRAKRGQGGPGGGDEPEQGGDAPAPPRPKKTL